MKLLNLNGDTLHEDATATTMAELLKSAIKSRANLSYANLSDANLSDANLSYANLSDANLSYANLSDANLSYANLSYANLSDANLSYANLSRADLSYANLSYANLSRADLSYANLSYADLSDANLSRADLSYANLSYANLSVIAPKITDIHKRLLEAVTAQGCTLDMSTWHQCETSHCRAGWVVTLAGEGGKILESVLGTGAAAALIYRASDPTMTTVPNWTASDEEAMADMKRLAGVTT
jgi:uncharacterized protein YjbI with pentapeptide repeats